jgi:hypothetical protein
MLCSVEVARAIVAAGRPGGRARSSARLRSTPGSVEETHAVYNVTQAAVWTVIRSAVVDLARHDPLAPNYLKTIPVGPFAQPVDVASRCCSWPRTRPPTGLGR